MSQYGIKIPKSQQPNSDPYIVYYPHTISHVERKWDQDYYQFVSIDPGKIKNFAFRIEKRYHNGKIIPLVFDKIDFESKISEGITTINNNYQILTEFLDKYKQFYIDTHFFVIEKQIPKNYQAVRVSQHVISYLSIILHNYPLLPAIVEIDAKLKGMQLGAPKGIGEKQLKTWAIVKGRQLSILRGDDFSLGVLDFFKNKQDDLCDTICQIEAIASVWGFTTTIGAATASQNDILSINGNIINLNNTSQVIIDGNVIDIKKLNSVKSPKLKIINSPDNKNNNTNKSGGLKLNVINQNLNK